MPHEHVSPHLRPFTGSLSTGLATMLLAAASASAGPAHVRMTRPAPGGVWCPAGPTIEEGRPGLTSSDPSVLNLGAMELSFVAPPGGKVYLSFASSDDVHIDNIVIAERWMLGDSSRFFPSDTCHRSGGVDLPRVLTPAFDSSGPNPGLHIIERFGGTTDDLIARGWTLRNATVDSAVSATELVAIGDDGTATASCPGSTTCSDGTGSLRLGPGDAEVVIPYTLPTGGPLTLIVWWDGDPGDTLDVWLREFAPCPETSTPSAPPDDRIVLSILSAEIDAGIDDDVWPIIDESDTEGDLAIDGAFYDLVQIPNDDTPDWGPSGQFVHRPGGQTVPIKIDLYDPDSLGDPPDHIDINPLSEPFRGLELTYDRCALTVSGDVNGPAQGVLTSSGDVTSGDNVGTVRFKVANADGRPASTDDIAVVGVDLVQVVHETRYAVSGKPAVVMLRLANQFTTTIDTAVRVEVGGPSGTIRDVVEPVLGLAPGEVRKIYLFKDSPFVVPNPPATPGPHTLYVNVTLDPDGIIREQYLPGDCRAVNDFASELEWKIVDTRDLDLRWCKAGRLIETSSLARDAWVDELDALGTSFIHGLYPVENVTSGRCLGGALAPINNALLDVVATVLNPIGIPLDAVIPFVMVWEFNDMAVLAGYDRMLGVLPDPGFFDRLSYGWWSSVGGLSLGEFAPHAVIFLPIDERDGGESGPDVVVPAHELGHTFGLSSDRRLKDPVWCGTDLPGDVDALICGATGGLDEYKSPDPFRAWGNPATGFWLAQGGEDPRIGALTGTEQCGRHCLMGGGSLNQHLHWDSRGKWIDREDWEHLVEKLATHPDPELVYVSGLVDAADNAAFGPWFRLPGGVPDRVDDGSQGAYGLVFYDLIGNVLQTISLPAHFGASDMPIVPPVSFFGFTVPWPADTTEIELWRWDTQSVLATRSVSATPPEVVLAGLPQGLVLDRGEVLPLDWTGTDADNDELFYYLMLSGTGGQTWEPLTGPLSDPFLDLDTSALTPGLYTFKVVVTDGIHRSESAPSPLVEITPGEIFSDGFESGGPGAWSAVVP